MSLELSLIDDILGVPKSVSIWKATEKEPLALLADVNSSLSLTG